MTKQELDRCYPGSQPVADESNGIVALIADCHRRNYASGDRSSRRFTIASDIKSILGDSVVNSVGLVLVPVPAEEFQIGVPESESVRDDDKLRHLVQITKPSSLCAYEVARKQYEKVMGNNPSYRKGENKQVNYVHWNDAIEFCCKLSGQEGVVFRLLTSDFGQTFNCSVALADATVAVVHTRRTILTTPPSVAAIMLV